MNRFKVTVSYDGTNFCGWQKQLNGIGIQDEIERVLQVIHKKEVTITASGRTDAKVHALGQVFHFDSDKTMDLMQWKYAMNRLLPQSIRIQSVKQVDVNFHARFDVVSKRYDYCVSNQIDNPFIQNYMGLELQVLDIAYMQECADIFCGTHDFTSFTSAKIDPRKSKVKTISHLKVCQEDGYVRLIFVGSGFLRYMVRMIAQTLIEAGKHKITKQEIEKMLKSKDKQCCRFKAVASGLYLVKVWYGGDEDEGELSYTHFPLSSCKWK